MEPLKQRLERLKGQNQSYHRFYEIIQEYIKGTSDEFQATPEQYLEIYQLLDSLYLNPQKRDKPTAISEEAYNQCMSMIFCE